MGVIDNGVQSTAPDLAGRISPLSRDIVGSRNQLHGPETHGSELSSIIAGAANGSGVVGAAFNATILAIRADDTCGPGCGFLTADLARGIDFAVESGVDIINLSLGGVNPLGPVFEQALANATARGVIVVVSAGNDGTSGAIRVNYPGRYALDPAISNGLILIAGASDASGQVVPFSNPAADARDVYLLAPGLQIIVPDFNEPGPTNPNFQSCSGGFCQVQGTSYSSPHLAGAVALLRSAFPGLTPQELVQLTLQSARDVGAPGVDDRTGRGVVDLARAFQPIGTTATPLAKGGSVTPGAPLAVVGGAMGDAFQRVGALQTVAFDSFGRTFDVSYAASFQPSGASFAPAASPLLWRSVSAGPGGSHVSFAWTEPQAPLARIEGLSPDDPDVVFRSTALLPGGVDLQVGFRGPLLQDASGAVFNGFLGLAQDSGIGLRKRFGERFSLGVISQSGETPTGMPLQSVGRRLFAGRVELAEGPLSMGLTAGRLREQGGVLGSSWTASSVGDGGSASAGFMAVDADVRLRRSLRLSTRLELGRTRAGEVGFFEGGAQLTSSAAAATLRWDAAPAPHGLTGALVFSAAQPLRVEGGGFVWRSATATAYGRQSLTFTEQFVRADPSGRQIETRVAYELYGAGRISARAEVARISDPGHVEAAPAAYTAGAGFRLAF